MQTTTRFALLLLSLGTVHAQEILWSRTGVYDDYGFSEYLGVLGDLNGDGYDDLVDVVTSVIPASHTDLFFLSGRDGTTLRIKHGAPTPAPSYFRVWGTGDMNADGIPDYATIILDAWGQRVILEIASGADDRMIWRTSQPWSTLFGYGYAGNVDLDGDGRPDVLVTDVRTTYGTVYAFSNSGSLLYAWSPTSGTLAVGRSVAGVGDVDGDSCDDFVTGGFGPDTNGRVALVSGRTGTLIRVAQGEPGDEIGHSVTGCGDVDGDGIPDFASGNSDFMTLRCVVKVFSGATGAPIYTLTGGPPQGNAFGWSIAGGADVDQDGVRDIVVGAHAEVYSGGEGAGYVFSGRDGSVLFREAPGGREGFSVVTMPPQPGSVFPYFLVTAPRYGDGGRLSALGRIRCFRGSPPGVQSFGKPGGTLATTPRIGLRDLGTGGVRIHLSGAEPGQPAALLLGLSRTLWAGLSLPLGLDPFGLPQAALLVSPDLLLWTTAGIAGTSRGYAYHDLPIPLAVPPGTFTLHGQWLCLGSNPATPGSTSDALLWRH